MVFFFNFRRRTIIAINLKLPTCSKWLNEMDVLRQLNLANKKRESIFPNGWDLPRWGNAVAGETGELCNIIKKIDRGDFTIEEANERELIADEVADIVCYLDLLCQKAGVDLRKAIVNKFNKVSDKKGSDIKIYYY